MMIGCTLRPKKANEPISVSTPGILTVFKFIKLIKEESSLMLFKPSPKSTALSALHPAKSLAGNVSSPSILEKSKKSQQRNAYFPI